MMIVLKIMAGYKMAGAGFRELRLFPGAFQYGSVTARVKPAAGGKAYGTGRVPAQILAFDRRAAGCFHSGHGRK